MTDIGRMYIDPNSPMRGLFEEIREDLGCEPVELPERNPLSLILQRLDRLEEIVARLEATSPDPLTECDCGSAARRRDAYVCDCSEEITVTLSGRCSSVAGRCLRCGEMHGEGDDRFPWDAGAS